MKQYYVTTLKQKLHKDERPNSEDEKISICMSFHNFILSEKSFEIISFTLEQPTYQISPASVTLFYFHLQSLEFVAFNDLVHFIYTSNYIFLILNVAEKKNEIYQEPPSGPLCYATHNVS